MLSFDIAPFPFNMLKGAFSKCVFEKLNHVFLNAGITSNPVIYILFTPSTIDVCFCVCFRRPSTDPSGLGCHDTVQDAHVLEKNGGNRKTE